MKQNTVRTENTRYIQAKQDGYVWNVRNCTDYMKEKLKQGLYCVHDFAQNESILKLSNVKRGWD